MQRGEALERRASRRFSAYQFAKLVNGGLPVPKDSITELPQKVNRSSTTSYLPTKSPHSTSRADFTSSTTLLSDGELPSPGLIPGVFPDSLVPRTAQRHSLMSRNPSIPESSSGETEEMSTTLYRITLYLQCGRSVKKCLVEPSELTIPALRLLFTDKFSYSHSEAFPEIYIQDPKSGIRYELDESVLANDVHNGTLLSLNVEAMDEVKTLIDEGLSTLTKHIVDLNNKVTVNSDSINKLSLAQQGMQQGFQTPKTGSRWAGSSIQHSPASSHGGMDTALSPSDSVKLASLRKDVAVVRQISSTAIIEIRSSLTDLIAKSQTLQSESSLPPPGDSSRSFMEHCFKKLSNDSDKLLTDMDDLQDVIEGLRKDVAQRSVRPDERKLESVFKDLEAARADMETLEKFMLNEKAGWKKIWERELDKICEEQQTLKLHEDIVIDLFDDLQKATQTFELVEQCSSERTKAAGTTQPRVMLLPPVKSVIHAKDAVLSEVSALQPNHERRVEAIERAEKMRKKELHLRGFVPVSHAFLEELGDFVGESKLKKSGGVDEIERLRKVRDAKNRQEADKINNLLQDSKEQSRASGADGRKKKGKKEKKDKKKKTKDGKSTSKTAVVTQDQNEAELHEADTAAYATPSSDDDEEDYDIVDDNHEDGARDDSVVVTGVGTSGPHDEGNFSINSKVIPRLSNETGGTGQAQNSAHLDPFVISKISLPGHDQSHEDTN